MPVKKGSNGKWRVNNGKPVYRSKKNAEKVERVYDKLKEKSRRSKR